MKDPSLDVAVSHKQASLRHLVGAIPLKQDDEQRLRHRHMTLDIMAGRGDEPSTVLFERA